MKKLIVSGALALSVSIGLFAGVAAAQSYYPSYSTGSYVSGGCVSITQNLGVGSRGAQVLTLQRFIVAQNYPGSGTWMETSYYGAATAAGVRIFQQTQGLPQTGAVDVNTQLAIDRVSCGGSSYTYPTQPTYPSSPYTTPTYPTYPTYPSYPYQNSYNAPVITLLSQNTGNPGNTVTITGQGFTPTNNTVYFGGTALSGISSYNGTSLTFTIPYISTNSSNQTLSLYVSDAYGTSNSVTFTLNPSVCSGYGGSCGCSNAYAYTTSCNPCGYNYSSYPYNYGSNGCSNCGTYPYTSGCSNTGTPTLTYLSPQSGGAGTSVTVFGSGFSSTGDSVRFGNGVITGLSSNDGQSISFVVPSQITGFGSQPLTIGSYNVSVTNASGITSNALPFNVTSTSANGAPTITSVSGPSNLSVGMTGTWQVTVNNPNTSLTTVGVTWGDTGNGYVNQAAPQQISGGIQTVSFSHAYITNGSYTVTFTIGNVLGQSQNYTTTVNVSGSTNGSGTPTVTYLTPNSGYVGNQVTIYGTNFSTSGNNVILFGSGALQNVFSNGSSITFTVPSSVGPYCQPGYACAQYLQQITPGTYNVSVLDQWGTSNQVPFTVL